MPNATPKRPADLRQRLGDPSKGKKSTARVKAPDMQSVPGLTANPPSDVSAEAQAMWVVVTSTAKWLVESDTPSLVLLCRLHDKVMAAMGSNDISASQASLVKTYIGLLEKFGLVPSARINLGLAVAETESKLAEFRRESA